MLSGDIFNSSFKYHFHMYLNAWPELYSGLICSLSSVLIPQSCFLLSLSLSDFFWIVICPLVVAFHLKHMYLSFLETIPGFYCPFPFVICHCLCPNAQDLIKRSEGMEEKCVHIHTCGMARTCMYLGCISVVCLKADAFLLFLMCIATVHVSSEQWVAF